MPLLEVWLALLLLAKLDASRCKLRVDLALEFISINQSDKVETLTRDTLTTIANAGFPIHELSTWPTEDHKATFYGEAFPLTVTKSIRRMSYWVPFYRDSSFEFALESVPQVKVQRSMKEICPVLASIEHLKSLSISTWNSIWDHPRYENNVVQLTGKMLLANSSAHLRDLELYMVILPDFDCLLWMLRRCQNTLERLSLCRIAAYSEQNLWPAVLEIVHDMAALRRLLLMYLVFGAVGGRLFDVVECCNYPPAQCHPLRCRMIGKAEIEASLTRLK